MTRKSFLLLFVLLALLAGCESRKEQKTDTVSESPQAPKSVAMAQPEPLLKSPREPSLFDYPTEALGAWRQFRDQRPTLVLLSRDPFLAPIPAEAMPQAIRLIEKGSVEELVARAALPVPDPVLLPGMALSAALQSGLFDKVLWVLPSPSPAEKLSVDVFRRQLRDFGAVTEEEAESFSADETKGSFSGVVRGIPFTAVHPEAMTAPGEAAILHIDLSYFAPLYKGEIKTPLYPLIHQTLAALRDTGMNTLAVTLSSSHATGDLPLESRFIGPNLVELFRNPEMLGAPFPEQWIKRANALYLPNFFKTEEARDIYLELEAANPSDASIKFALYQSSRELKEGTRALEYLAKAAALDPVFALEYLNLASIALDKKLPDQAIRMMKLAREAFPDNPFVELQLARLLVDTGNGEIARPILENLAKLSWSQVYYPGMQKHLEGLMTAAKEGKDQKILSGDFQ